MNQNHPQGLPKLLASCLPQDERFFVLQLQSVPTETHPIVTPKAKCESPLTVKVQHFFALFHHEKIVYALEVYVYLTLWFDSDCSAERLIFISKADTTGYCDVKLSFKELTKTLIEYLTSIDPDYYLHRIKPRVRNYVQQPELLTHRTNPIHALRILSKRHGALSYSKPEVPSDFYLSLQFPVKFETAICLFTRPAPQYLFAESSKNPNKHCLNGVQLLNWWLSILDDILCHVFESTSQAKLQIPGESTAQVRRHLDSVQFGNWQVGYVFGKNSSDLAAYTIPLLPDDPKTRFLRQLAEEGRINIVDLETFWIELAERQEFRLSETVSVMGVRGIPSKLSTHVPSSDDVFTAPSKKRFDYIKSYITGEEYDTEEGAFEAFANIRDFFSLRLNRSLQMVVGTMSSIDKEKFKRPVNPEEAHSVTTLVTRKKPKK
ncbi:related to Histone acetyltransferase RTT109 [Zygosaccharomyces bailii]|nr:related to Histone acetyltransferase RTT109 [Zygosaccharomyces bailii]